MTEATPLPPASDIAEVLTSFEHGKPKKVVSPVRMVLNGKILKMCSGKSVWKKKGDAKAALRHHIEQIFSYVYPFGHREGKYVHYHKDTKEVIKSEDFEKRKEELVQFFYKSVEFKEIFSERQEG